MPGPPKTVTGSTKKKQKAAQAKRRRAESVRIGSLIDTWEKIKAENGLEKDEEVAEMLISCYKESQQRKRKRTFTAPSSESSSITGSKREVQMSGIEALSSESDIGTFAVPSTSTPKDVHKADIVYAPRMTKVTSVTADHKGSRFPMELESSFQVSFDDGELDAGEVVDENDPEYIPSDWDISMNVAPPEGPFVEMDLDADVHDIGFGEEDSDIPAKETTGKKDSDVPSKGTIRLCHVTPSDEEEPMVMVSASSLQRLTDLVPYSTCTKCKEKTEVKRHTEGCGWKLKWECKNAHLNYTWSSQPVLPNGVMLGNFKMAASIILSGNNYAKVALLFKFLRVGLPSQTAFNQIQSNFVVPVVNTYWQNMKASAQEEHRSTGLVIAGDGRMDSPGHTANFCTYTMMNQDGKKILAMEVVDKREVQLKSGRMEAKGFERAMADILGAGVNVVEVVTDAHTQISSIMKNQFPGVKHSWDMWHGAKNMGKKLCAAANEKGNQLLKPWVSDITNHFYYSAEHCNGDTLLLKDKLFSVMHHCTNKHAWALGACDHEPIREDEVRSKEWLHPQGSEMSALRKVITDRRFTNGLHHYATCQTTSELESFNNHLLMYASKRHGFSFPVYRCRSYLAAIDYMYHIDRPLRKNKNGETYYSRTYSKAANHWTFKLVKVPKTYNYIPEIMLRIVNTYTAHHKEQPLSRNVVQGLDDPRRMSSTIAPSTPPPTGDIVRKYQSRLEKWPRPSTSTE